MELLVVKLASGLSQLVGKKIIHPIGAYYTYAISYEKLVRNCDIVSIKTEDIISTTDSDGNREFIVNESK